MNSNIDNSNNIIPTTDNSNNIIPTDKSVHFEDIDIYEGDNDNNQEMDEKYEDYAVKNDIESGLDYETPSLKYRTANLGNTSTQQPYYEPSDNSRTLSTKLGRLIHNTDSFEPIYNRQKSISKSRSTFRSVFLDVSDRTSVSDSYSDEQKSRWLNNTHVQQISITDYFMFYLNSLRNNKQYKFRYIEYVGDLKTINEFCDNIIGLLLDRLEEENSNAGSDDSEIDMVPFLNEHSDKLVECFHKIDSFIRNNLYFMKLCSAPVDLFLERYYSARNNSCGLIKHTNFTSSHDWLCREEINENYYYIPYLECVDRNIKNTYREDLENQIYMHCTTSKNVSVRRIAAIHNLFGELWALCEFIKTTIELNDQLLFKVIMLFGNFMVLLGEYVWNTALKERYTR